MVAMFMTPVMIVILVNTYMFIRVTQEVSTHEVDVCITEKVDISRMIDLKIRLEPSAPFPSYFLNRFLDVFYKYCLFRR